MVLPTPTQDPRHTPGQHALYPYGCVVTNPEAIHGWHLTCRRGTAHEGDHEDALGRRWPEAARQLARLTAEHSEQWGVWTNAHGWYARLLVSPRTVLWADSAAGLAQALREAQR